jgi:hypothetical protein
MFLTLNEVELLLNDMKPKICIERILGAMEDGWVGAEEFPKLVNLRLFPRSLIAALPMLPIWLTNCPRT